MCRGFVQMTRTTRLRRITLHFSHRILTDGRTFIGYIAAFTGEPTICACVAVEPTDVIAFDRAGLR